MPNDYINKVTLNGVDYDMHDDSAVRFDTAQTLTAAQQKQARENIDALEPDGYYEGFTSGNAEQLVSSIAVSDNAPYLLRPAGGNNDIGNRETVKSITGVSLPWNQLVENGNFVDSTGWITGSTNTLTASGGVARLEIASGTSATNRDIRATTQKIVDNGHVYLVSFDALGTGAFVGGVLRFQQLTEQITIIDFGTLTATKTRYAGICKPTGLTDPSSGNYRRRIVATPTAVNIGDYFEVSNFTSHDLTQMFGTAIANYVNSLEQSNAGSGIAWLKSYGFFAQGYYPYNAGGMKHVSGLVSHDMVGFNAYDPDTGKAHVVGGHQYQITGAYTALSLNGETITPDANGLFTPSVSGDLTVTGGNSTTTCVHLTHSGYRNGEYEPYVKHSYALDSTVTLRGVPKLDASNNLYFDGDTYESDGTVTRKYGIVDLGTLDWAIYNHVTYGQYFYAGIISLGVKRVGDFSTTVFPAVCSKYVVTRRHGSVFVDKTYCFDGSALAVTQIQVKDSSYTDAAAFKTAMSGVMLVYELATPTEETAAPYSEIQICDDFGTEEYVVTPDSDGFQMPVGHETEYMQNLRDKLQRLPNLPDADGTYLVQYSNRQCSFVQYIAPTGLPTAPSGDGTYALKATVADGVVTYSWVAE